MFKRKIELSLLDWKNDKVHKPIVLFGARQVGKTSVVRKFGNANFKELIEINLENLEHRKKFVGVESVADFERRLVLINNQKMEKGKLLFIDEVQELKEVMGLLRFFMEEKPEWHVIVTGSLLEVKMGGKWNIPVGRVDYRYLFPLTFFEFLEAINKQELLTDLQKITVKSGYKYHDIARRAYDEYLILGGMPEVVADFADTKNYDRAREILSRLQRGYLSDIEKYTRNVTEKKYLEVVVSNGAKVAGKSFQYEHFAGTEYHSREMSAAIARVEKTMLCNLVPVTNSTVLPMNLKLRRSSKMLWLDIGLVNLINEYYGEIIQSNYLGEMMEQVVGQTLLAQLIPRFMKLAYYAKDRDEGSAEVDFCFSYKGRMVMIEVKSGKSVYSRSLQVLIDKQKDIVPVVVSWEELKREDQMLKLPFYLLERLEELIE